MTISPVMTALIARMEEHPDEFINSGWCPINNPRSQYDSTRWEEITERIKSNHAAELGFSDEEIAAYTTKLGVLIRAKIESSIITEIIGARHAEELAEQQAYRSKQLVLPLGTSMLNAQQTTNSTLTMDDVTRKAMAILGSSLTPQKK